MVDPANQHQFELQNLQKCFDKQSIEILKPKFLESLITQDSIQKFFNISNVDLW